MIGDSYAQAHIRLAEQNKELHRIADLCREICSIRNRGNFMDMEEVIRTKLEPAIDQYFGEGPMSQILRELDRE